MKHHELKKFFLLVLTPVVCSAPAWATSPALHVSGNQIVTSGGCTVRLRGVNVDSMEWYDNNGYPGEGPGNNVVSVAQEAVTGWHCNVIRLPLNQDYWFGCAGVGSLIYQTAVSNIVNFCAANNAYVVLDLHWSGTYNGTSGSTPCGGAGWKTSTGQQNMPDWNAVTFWSSVGAAFANNPAVFFDLYNEPHLDSLSGAGAWGVWRNGGATSNTPAQTPGLQALLTAVRNAGANNIVLAGGLSYAYDLSGINAGYSLTDTGSGSGVVYSAHIYGTTKGTNSSIWDTNVTNATTNYPVFMGEFGPDIACPPNAGDMTSFDTTFFNWVGGTNSKSYVYPGATGWSFHISSQPCMISSWTYVANSWGQAVSTWLLTPVPNCSGPTNTPTNTATLTPSGTPTNTATPTNSRTPTGTPTFTPSSTSTASRTNTPTFSPTGTPTNTPSLTPSPTMTASPTDTFTGQPTDTPTASPTLTPTATITLTPTDTFTGQPTDTPTSTLTPTPSATPTDTPTSTFTGQPTNTPPFTPSNTATSTATPSFTATTTATSSPTSTNTVQVTPSFTPTQPPPTSTPGSAIVISQPYPNPNYGPVVEMDISGAGLSAIHWDVFTAAFRKIKSQKVAASTFNHLVWNMMDMEGSPVSDGLYYFRVELDGVNGKTVVIKKVLVLR